MALPKRRTSLANKRARRTHKKLSAGTIAKCTNCNEPKLPHRACPNCGFYKGKQVVAAKED